MTKYCHIFPGQGSQKVGMGKSIYENHPSSKTIFDLDKDITDLMFNGLEEELTKTINCQPAIFLCNLAYFEILKHKYPPSLTIGHSVGEYSALVASKAISQEQALNLVKIRANLMSTCIPERPKENTNKKITHMLAVKLDDFNQDYKTVKDICDKITFRGKGLVQIACVNSPTQIVISGNINKIEEAKNSLKKRFLKSTYVPVEGPFHSKLMLSASLDIRDIIEETIIQPPEIPYITNTSAKIIDSNKDPNQIKQSLIEQIVKPVLWKQSLELAIEMGYTFIESGNKDIQTKMIKNNYPDAKVIDKE